MRFGVLGPVEAWDGQRRLSIGGPQQRALLAVLLLHANQVVSTDQLVDHLWGDNPPATARSLLQGCVAGLRRALRDAAADDRLETVVPGYRLRVGAAELDLDQFTQLADQAGHTPDPLAAAEYLAEALSIWRGPALEGIDLVACQAAATRLEERRLTVLEQRIDLDLQTGRRPQLISELRILVQAHPLRERLWAQLMLALHAADRRAEALDVYRELRQTLVEQLGVEPATSLRQLHRAILAGGDPLVDRPTRQPPAPAPAPALAAAVVPAQLPAPPAAFTGRTGQLKRLNEVLADTDRGLRVSTIAGMAGVGKTALAIRWGHGVRERFPDGQLYANLRGYAATPPMLAIEVLAGFLQALGVPADQVPAELEPAAAWYRSLLADKQVLVILDNARSLEQVRPLLPGGDGCLTLVTSRDRLAGLVAIEGAAHLALDVLSPDEAGELLGHALDNQRVLAEPAAAAELARLCGYLPLAIRIAAADLSLHPDRLLADQAAQLSAGDRLSALTVDQDETSAVRAAFDHSYTSLAPAERRLLRMLGLVPGPHVTVGAAAALAGVAPDRAARLISRLARVYLVEEPASDRYSLHDLVRLYAARRATEEDTVDDRRVATGRLFDWYLRTADAATRLLYPEVLRLPGSEPAGAPAPFDDRQAALAWLEAERPNLLAAIEHTAGSGPHSLAYQLADALQGFYWSRMYPVEWLAVTEAGLSAARAADDPHAQAAAEYSLGNIYLRLVQYDRSIEHCLRGLTLGEQCGWIEVQCRALSCLGTVYRREWRVTEALESFRRALTLSRQCGWLAGEATSLTNLGLVLADIGDIRGSVAPLDEALALHRRLGSPGREALCLGILGVVHYLLGQLDDAETHLARSVELAQEVGDRSTAAEAKIHLATVHREAGRHQRALDLVREALAAARELGDYGIEVFGLISFAWTHIHLGQHLRAQAQLEEALRLVHGRGNRMHETKALIALAAALRGLGQLDEATEAGNRALVLARDGRDRVEEGDALAALAAVDVAAGRLGEAIANAERAVAIHRKTGHRLGEARALRELGHALHLRGDTHAATAHRRRAYTLLTEVGSPEADPLRTLQL